MILITGGTGFLGKELVKKLYKKVDIRVVARNEGKLIELKQQYPDIEIICGDVADGTIAFRALQGITGVYHLAAFKHVGLAEDQVYQCTRSNVLGTMNLLNGFSGDLFVFISTDKAAKVSGVYGASKLICEGLVMEQSKLFPDRRYVTVRYGNVLWSTGSVLHKWKDAIINNKEVIITDPTATRFFFTVDQALELIFEAMECATSAGPYITEMKSMEMGDLLKAMIRLYGQGRDTAVKTIGLQQGENKHEELFEWVSSEYAERYTIDEISELL